ncbi:acyltransferase-domain-containing protein [Leucogyrophana mollusca]|uniref:Acyltransferase-domain-containing protein n=1 Tax=Leucogyrophana mollusca TaxID=85980 RepID=A0ACB8C064_9AGAM|nr:acyltransferase-domain-containing protein [Leucogyrophana mollusca]
MSFLACIVKPLAYISLPVFLIRTIASTSPAGRYYVRLGVFLGSLAVVSTWGVAIAVGMTLVGRRHDVNYVVARCFYFVASRALDLRVEVEGTEHLETRPAVMVGNHQSMLDILWLARMFPRSASIMAKKELQWSPLGPWMFMSGALFVDRGNSAKAQRSLAAAGEVMKAQGTSLMMYPEGTRHSEEVPSLLPFKKGAFHLAVQAGIPITPVICENYWGIYHQGVLGTGTIKVRVLPPISTSGLTASDIPELATRVREQMLETLRDISVKVAVNEEVKAAEIPETQTESPPPAEEADPGPSTTNEIHPEVPETPSDESNSEAASVKGPRSLKQEGSEYGTETDDEGMVLVGRHH